MPSTIKNLFLILLALALSACASQRTVHTSGTLKLELGPGPTISKAVVKTFEDARPADQRQRRLFPDGEAYGDPDFTTTPPDAMLQELSVALATQLQQERIRARLAASSVVLRRTEFSLRIATAEKDSPNPGIPPGIAAVDSLMYAAFGGKTYLFCEIEVEIDGVTYLGTSKQVISGGPPPLNHTYVPYFAQAVGKVLKQFASRPD